MALTSMKTKFELFAKMSVGKIIFVIAVFVSIYWWLSQTIDIYQFKLIGAFYEILWLPAIAALALIPVISLIFWTKEKFTLKSFHPFAILIIVITILALTIGQ